jgi:hypothetical protein
MATTNKYYERFIEHLYSLLKNKGQYKDENGFCIVAGKEPHSYYIQSLMHSTKEEKINNPVLMGMFINDLNEYLINNKPFKLLRKDQKYYETLEYPYDYFFEIFRDHLYDASRKNAVKPLNPSLEQFTKILNCFAPIIDSTKDLLKSMSYYDDIFDNHYNEFAHAILSLPYYQPFDPNYDYYASDIHDELFQLYSDKKNNFLLKDGIINYLKNRKLELQSIKDKDENYQIYDHIKTIIPTEYWEEIALLIPNLGINKKNPQIVENLFNLNDKPIYQINLNHNAILDISKTIVTHKDLFEIIVFLNKFINQHKPNGIDYIMPIHLDDKFFITMVGESLNKDLAYNIGSIFEKMLREYNSDNIIKEIVDDENIDNEEKNADYLNKAAANFWLEIELSNLEKSSSNKKVKKI